MIMDTSTLWGILPILGSIRAISVITFARYNHDTAVEIESWNTRTDFSLFVWNNMQISATRGRFCLLGYIAQKNVPFIIMKSFLITIRDKMWRCLSVLIHNRDILHPLIGHIAQLAASLCKWCITTCSWKWGKAENLIRVGVDAEADLDIPGWIKFVMMLGSSVNVVVHRGCQKTWSGTMVCNQVTMTMIMNWVIAYEQQFTDSVYVLTYH